MTNIPCSDSGIQVFKPDFAQLDRSDIEAQAVAEVLQELGSNPTPAPRLRAVPNDKWLLSAATQKLIRLGDSEWAVGVAQALHRIDPEYLPKRLPIIAVEDIGIADIELCTATLHLCGDKKFRGPLEAEYQSAVLRTVVRRLAEAVKSRAACDAFCLGQSHPDTPRMMPALLGLNTDGLVAIASDRRRSLLKRINALRVLAGMFVREGGQYRTLSSCQPEALRQVADRCGVPPIITYLTGQARRTASLAAMLPIACELLATEANVATQPDFPNARKKIKGVPACAFDMFSEVGRAAIAQFMTDALRVKEFITEKARTRSPLRLLNMALFHTESSRLHRYLASDSMNQLTQTVEAEEMREHGMIEPDDRHSLYALLESQADVLYQARRTTASRLFGGR